MSLFYIKELPMENVGEVFSTVVVIILIVLMVINRE